MTDEPLNIPPGHIERDLNQGWIQQWLLAGPDSQLAHAIEPDFRSARPSEGAAIVAGDLNRLGAWQIVPCAEDHLLHLDLWARHTVELQAELQADLQSDEVQNPGAPMAAAWLWAALQTQSPGSVTLQVVHTHELAIWVNGERVYFGPETTGQDSPADTTPTAPISARVDVALRAGQNELRLYTRRAGWGRWFVGVQVADPEALAGARPDRAVVESTLLPTNLTPVERREKLAEIFAQAYLEREVFQAKERIWLKWPATSLLYENLTVRLQSPDRRIFAEGNIEAMAGARVPIAWPDQLADGRYDVVVMPRSEEYYQKEMRILRRIPIHTVKNVHSVGFYGEYAARCEEALADAAKRRGIYAELAKLALGKSTRLKPEAIDSALAMIEGGAPQALQLAVCLLGGYLRFGEQVDFPPRWKPAIEKVAQRRVAKAIAAHARDRALLEATAVLLASQVLAGQSTAAQATAEQAKSGEQGVSVAVQAAVQAAVKRAEEILLGWGRWGFANEDGPTAFENMIVSLSHLVDLAGQWEDVAELAAVVLDKVLFTVAVNSFQGVWAGGQGQTTAPMILGPGASAIAGPARIAWGKGAFNEHVAGTLSLACCAGYETPDIVAAIGVDSVSTFIHREQHAQPFATQEAPASESLGLESIGPEPGIEKMTWRSPTGMLASIQEPRLGQPGQGEHIWQATLGPGGAIFVNYPAYGVDAADEREMQLNGRSSGPGFWLGNAVLPHVAQAENLLCAWYRLPADVGMGFTHAHFPRAFFDEHYITPHWAFGRKGKGYVALYAASGLTPVEAGSGVWRELRAFGLPGANGETEPAHTDSTGERQEFWLCRVGSEAEDGSFAEFRAAVESARIDIHLGNAGGGDGAGARIENLWGKDVTFGPQAPLRVSPHGALHSVPQVDGADAVSALGPLHYAGEFARAPLPADWMELDYKGHVMRLTFAEPDTLSNSVEE